MFALLFLFVSSCAITHVLTPLFRDLALRLGWVDMPDPQRKIHSSPIPRVGGIALFVAYAAAWGLLELMPLAHAEPVRQSFRMVCRLMPAAAVIFLTGFLDDRFDLRPWQKLLGQLTAAALACAAGVEIRSVAGSELAPWIAAPVTILWLVACTNALNLIDGMDGLASGVGLFATLTTLAAGLLHGDIGLALAAAPLAGALIASLRFNFSPATVFLGDAGSLWLGLLLGAYGVIWTQKSVTALGMTAPLMALAVPLFDTTLAVARRFLRSKPIFSADRGHIHHRLLDLGLTTRQAVLLLYAASGMAACLALLATSVTNQWRGVVLFVFCIAAWMSIQRLKYDEFRAVCEVFRSLRSLMHQQLRLRSFESNLSAASTPEECLRAVRDGAREFGFSSVAVQLRGARCHETLRRSANGQLSVRIPLPGSDYVHLTRDLPDPDSPPAITSFAAVLHRVLAGDSGLRDRRAEPGPAAPKVMAANTCGSPQPGGSSAIDGAAGSPRTTRL